MSKMPNIRLTSVEDLFKTDEERQTDKLEKVQIVPAELVHPYPREPYQVDRATADLVQLMDGYCRADDRSSSHRGRIRDHSRTPAGLLCEEAGTSGSPGNCAGI